MWQHEETACEKMIGVMRVSGGLAVLFVFPAAKVHSAMPTIKVSGPYPCETPVQVPAPPLVSDSSPVPSPAPFPYPESSPSLSTAPDRDPGTANARRPTHGESDTGGSIQIQWSSKFLWISGSTSCRRQCVRSKTPKNTHACKRRPCNRQKCSSVASQT